MRPAIDGHEHLLEAAQRIARQCRWVIQGCLREEEWIDADREFERIILEGLKELWTAGLQGREGRDW